MDRSKGLEVVRSLSERKVALRDAFSLERADIDSLGRLARQAFENRHYDEAIRLLGVLEALEPDRPRHVLHRALAEVENSTPQEAIATLSHYIQLDAQRPKLEIIRALKLRAELRHQLGDTRGAVLDLKAAEVIERSTEERT